MGNKKILEMPEVSTSITIKISFLVIHDCHNFCCFIMIAELAMAM